MLIHRMNATFGKLQNSALELKSGLNILEAPNEAGKSTWCSFFLSMFYGTGAASGEDITTSDSLQYLPWSGLPMGGELCCEAGGQAFRIRRGTEDPSRPMEAFEAVDARTGQPVGLDGESAGKTLLGVEKEVYTRSGFIRQADVSFTRSRALDELVRALAALPEEVPPDDEPDPLPETPPPSAAEAVPWWTPEDAAAILSGNGDWTPEEVHAARLRAELEERHIPEADTIARLRRAVVNLLMAQKAVAQSRDAEKKAKQILLEAEVAAAGNPFHGKTPEEAAETPLHLPKMPRFPLWTLPLIAAASIAAGVAVHRHFHTVLFAFLTAVFVLLALLLPTFWFTRQRQSRWNSATVRRRRRQQADLKEYRSLYRSLERARESLSEKTKSAETLHSAFTANSQALLREVRLFAPDVADLVDADERLRVCGQQRKELALAEDAARAAALRRTAQSNGQTPVNPPAPETSPVPVETATPSGKEPDATTDADSTETPDSTENVDSTDTDSTENADSAETDSTADADSTETPAQKPVPPAQTFWMEDRHGFRPVPPCPILEHRASKILGILTEGRYSGVKLDENMMPYLAVKGTYRPASRLSEGCSNQLYFAVRLALCQLILPQDAPLVLDDALADFDDRRCAAALRLLEQEADRRQILLFTCHSREGRFFSGDRKVFVQRLTEYL